MNFRKYLKEAERIQKEIKNRVRDFGPESRLFPRMRLGELVSITNSNIKSRCSGVYPLAYFQWCVYGSNGGCYFDNALVLYPIQGLRMNQLHKWDTKSLDSKDEPDLYVDDAVEIGFIREGTCVFTSIKTGIVILSNEGEATIIKYDSFAEFMDAMHDAYYEYGSVEEYIFKLFEDYRAKREKLKAAVCFARTNKEKKNEEKEGNAEGCADPESVPAAG